MKYRRLFKVIFKLMYKLNPDTLAWTIPIDDITDLHYLVEKSYDDRNEFGIRTSYYVDKLSHCEKISPNRYVKKHVIAIDAVKWDGNNLSVIKDFVGKDLEYTLSDTAGKFPVIDMKIHTLEGIMKVSEGDYIIKGVDGEFYPCKPDIFEKTYDKIDK